MKKDSHDQSHQAFNQACQIFPGGVNSPVRAFKAVGGNPIFIDKAKGSQITDVDGNKYLDLVQSWGAHILGHGAPEVLRAVRRQLSRGTSFGAPTKEETVLGNLIRRALPSMERLRFVSSGTEAVMSAIRLARGFTRRPYIIKFDGCYHGHGDSLLVKAGSGLATHGIPDSAGVPGDLAALTLSLPYNDLGAVEKAFHDYPGKIAGLIIEPVPGNMGVVPPAPGYLKALRDITEKAGSLLIFDEVISGFRVGLGGAQGRYSVTPDLTTLGKIIGGGFPVGAYGGRTQIMESLAPTGPVYQAGTLSGNPVAMAAGTAVLTQLFKPGFYERLEDKVQDFYMKFQSILDPKFHTLHHVGPLFTLFFTPGPIRNFQEVLRSDTQGFGEWFRGMLKEEIYQAPSQFEANFLGNAHKTKDLNFYLEKAKRVLGQMKGGLL